MEAFQEVRAGSSRAVVNANRGNGARRRSPDARKGLRAQATQALQSEPSATPKPKTLPRGRRCRLA